MVKVRNHRKLYIGILVVLVLGVAALELTNTTHLFHKSPTVSKQSPVITKLPSHPSSGNKEATTPTGTNKQTSVDKQGQKPTGVTDDQSKWLVSQSGVITVKSPTSNSTFKPGADLYGSASVGKVQYRLIDNSAGVISQGFINVVNGNFTATINFKPYSSGGRLDVFSADDNGKESNEVQVLLNF